MIRSQVRRVRKFVRKYIGGGRATDAIALKQTPRVETMNEWQAAFCEWQAMRLGVSEAEARKRFLDSANSIRGGHSGHDYHNFCMTSYAMYLPFVSDAKAEVLDAYEFHEHMHFLRFLGYKLRDWPADHPAVARIDAARPVVITDFGCGLAQNSISLARALRSRGAEVRLQLADVSRLQLAFLDWFCARDGFRCVTARCTAAAPIPDFAPADVLFAEEVLEHVHDPVDYVQRLDEFILPAGVILANLGRHDAEFMHVSPDLDRARERLLTMGYDELKARHVFGKPMASSRAQKRARTPM